MSRAAQAERSVRWTEARAWTYLAGRWDVAVAVRRRDHWATIFEFEARGLCDSVMALFVDGVIDGRLRARMLTHLGAHRPESAGPYWWPWTKAGARRRALVCRQLAREARHAREGGQKHGQSQRARPAV